MRLPKNIPVDELRTVAAEVLDHAGVTQKQAAEALGIAQPTVSLALSGQHRPYTEILVRLIETYSDYDLSGPIYRTTRRKQK